MNRVLSVCFLVLALVVGVSVFVLNQSADKVNAAGQATPPLQKGISVQMAVTQSAASVPEADRQDAWIVTVTADGRIYYGVEAVTAEGLKEQMRIRPRHRDAKLYVKADAGAPFSSVRQVLRAARADLFDDVVLLTSQPESASPGTTTPPKGFEIWIEKETAADLIAVQVGSEQDSAALTIDDEPVAPAKLQGKLAKLFDNRSGRIVQLKASDKVSYGQIVHAIDACHAAGASRVSMIVSPEV